MQNVARIYMEAVVGLATMAAIGFLSGIAAGAISGDRSSVIVASVAGFCIAGIVLTVRLWRMARPDAVSPGEPVP